MYPLAMEAVAPDGGLGFGSGSITVDLTAPVISISEPADGSTVNSDTPILVYSADEAVTIYLDDTLIQINSGEHLPPLTQEEHTVRIEASDNVGNTGSAETTFTVDLTPEGSFPWLMFLPAIIR
jgi:hypothetical protein